MANTVYKGVLKTWKDDRGFGFIQPDNGDKDIFVHISSLKDMARRPNRGDVLFYEVAKDAGGKLKAINARIEGVDIIVKSSNNANRRLWLSVLLLGLIAFVVTVYLLNKNV